MSEYQYYEFLAVDRPLTSKEMSTLRAVSTRADITPVSFTNVYNWSALGADRIQLMDHFFDAHVYVACWGDAVFMVRLPQSSLPPETVEAMAIRYVLDITATKNHWIITWALDDSENYDRFVMESGRGWMSRLAPVREELLRGDLRSLYIGWLSAVTQGVIKDAEIEPLSLRGLGDLTFAQRALVEFLEVDQDLLESAGKNSPPLLDKNISQQEIRKWIEKLPPKEVTPILKELLDGKIMQAERAIKNMFAAWIKETTAEKEVLPRRTVGELKKKAEEAKKIREKKEAEKRKREEIRRRKAREAELKKLSENFPQAWRNVRKLVKRGTAITYDQACRLLLDMREAYLLFRNEKQFKTSMKKLMAKNKRRKALIRRLVEAGIWEE